MLQDGKILSFMSAWTLLGPVIYLVVVCGHLGLDSCVRVSTIPTHRVGGNRMTKSFGYFVLHNNAVYICKRMELSNFPVFELFLETFLECLLCVSDMQTDDTGNNNCNGRQRGRRVDHAQAPY